MANINGTGVPIPSTSEDLEAAMLDDGFRAKVLESPEALKSFVTNYAKTAMANDPDLQDQLSDQQTKVMTDFLAKNGINLEELGRVSKRLPMGEAMDYSTGKGIYKALNLTAHEMKQIAATGEGACMEASGQFDTFGAFAQAMSPWATHKGMGVHDSRLKVLGEGQGDQGGFLVPEEFRAELLRNTLEASVIRPRARVIPMSTLTLRIPAIRDTTHASNVYGGVQGYWTPESGSFTQSEPTFAQVALTAKKLMGGTRVSNEMLRDSVIALEPLLTGMFSEALAYFEDDAFIAGIGGGQPLGILNADALVSVAKETGQAASTLVVENIVKMYSRMLPRSIPRSVWIMHPDVQPQLFTMSLSVGTGGAPMFFPAGGLGGSPVPTLLGRPIILSEKCETLGTAGDIYLADLSYYLIGDRQTLEMASSSHVRFNTDETDFRIIQRVDGRPWIDSALTPRNGSNTLSPFVALAARA